MTTNANCVNSCPACPRIRKSGRKTTIIVIVDATTALEISFVPSIAASWTDFLSRSMCLKMFSRTTTASSTIRPVASESPESVSVLSVNPHSQNSVNVEMIEIGIDSATTMVERKLRRNIIKMAIASAEPIIALILTSSTACSINVL